MESAKDESAGARSAAAGQPEAGVDDAVLADRILPEVYDELRRLAAGILRGAGGAGPARAGGGGGVGGARAGVTLQPTLLVHEAWLKLGGSGVKWESEGHFRAVAALAMRQVLADHARARRRLKRGGGRASVTLDTSMLGVDGPGSRTGPDLDRLDVALEELERRSPRMARLVVYRFFGDLSVEDAARRLGVSVSTAEADWRFARAWLRRWLEGGGVPA